MKVLAEIEQAKKIETPASIHFTPVWKFLLWNTYVKQDLDFMAETDSRIPTMPYKLGNVIIDNIQYLLVSSLKACFDTQLSYFTENNILYVHLEKHKPAWLFFNFSSGIMYGFTNQNPELIDYMQYLPDLINTPDIEISGDIFTHSRMRFNSGNVVFNNTDGLFDGILQVFGNNLTIFYEKEPDLYEIVMQYFIEKYIINSKTATFSIKDKRERLSNSCPNTFFEKEKYPFIEDKYKDKIIPDAYGQCRGVPAIPIDGTRIYDDASINMTERPDTDDNWWNYYSYKAARKITKITRVQVKMSDVNGDDIWVEVFPGLGVIGNTKQSEENPTDISNPVDKNFVYKNINPKPIIIPLKNGGILEATGNYQNGIYTGNIATIINGLKTAYYDNDGIINIFIRQALKSNPGYLYKRNGKTQDVKIDGVFNDLTKPGDIAMDIIKYYAGLPDNDKSFFDATEWNKNLEKLPPIGIVLNEKKSIYDYIEKIQNGCLLGWQLLSEGSKFTARLDNPNRMDSFHLTTTDIINIHNIEVEMDGENYATYTDIKYDHDIADNLSQSVIDKSRWEEIMDIYKFDKVFENESLLLPPSGNEKNMAELKGKILLDDFSKVRPILRGIELSGKQYFDLKLFQIGTIDFTIELPERLKILQPYLHDRYFMNTLRCKIINKKIDLYKEKVIIDVRQCSITFELPEFIELLDVTGEYPETEIFDYEFDNLFAESKAEEFILDLDGGGI